MLILLDFLVLNRLSIFTMIFLFFSVYAGTIKIFFYQFSKDFALILVKLVFWRGGAIGAIASLMGITISLLFIGIDSS